MVKLFTLLVFGYGDGLGASNISRLYMTGIALNLFMKICTIPVRVKSKPFVPNLPDGNGHSFTSVQKATPVGGTVQIKQLIVVPDRVLCTRYFVL